MTLMFINKSNSWFASSI